MLICLDVDFTLEARHSSSEDFLIGLLPARTARVTICASCHLTPGGIKGLPFLCLLLFLIVSSSLESESCVWRGQRAAGGGPADSSPGSMSLVGVEQGCNPQGVFFMPVSPAIDAFSLKRLCGFTRLALFRLWSNLPFCHPLKGAGNAPMHSPMNRSPGYVGIHQAWVPWSTG
jgi:hypothetical protein